MKPNTNRLALLATLLLLAITSFTNSTMASTQSVPLSGTGLHKDDLSWMRGANYVPSYAKNDIQTWMEYDPAVIDRELGYAERLKLNTVRVFLNVAVFEKQPETFLADFENFLTLADKHGIKVMPVLFDSCFDPQEVDVNKYKGRGWIPSPGFPRLGDKDWPAMEKFIAAVVGKYRNDKRIVLWDVMNEPESTSQWGKPGGKEQILEFVRRSLKRVKDEKPVQPIGIGWATFKTISLEADLCDVLILHNYLPIGDLAAAIKQTKEMSKTMNKPLIIGEFLTRPQQRVEKALPVIAKEKIGWCFWELMIGNTQFSEERQPYRGVPPQGHLYPDGTCFLPTEIAAFLHPEGFTGNATEIAKAAGFVVSDKVPKAFAENPDAIEVPWPFTDESICFSRQWIRKNGDGPAKNRHWSVNAAGETATTDVTGTSIELTFKHGPDCGIASVTIDGKPAAIAEVDTYAKAVDWNAKTVAAQDLPPGKHTVVVTVTGRKAPAANGCFVQLVDISSGPELKTPEPSVTPAVSPHFVRLPLGAVKPDGWLKRQLRIQADGLTGYVDEFVFTNSEWKGGKGNKVNGPPYRYISNYLEGLIPLAWQLGDERLQQKAKLYVEWLLASAQSDGWFGPPRQDENEEGPTNNAEYLACALKMLIDYSEATGDARVLPLAKNYLHYLDQNIQKWPRQFWWGTRAMEQSIVAYWVYEKTHDPEFLAIANRIHERAGNSWPEFDSWSKFFAAFPWDEKALLERRIPRAAHTLGKTSHGVALAWAVKFPALRYLSTGAEIDRLGSLRAIEVLDRYHGQAAGRFSCDEHLAGRSPIQGTELCTVMEQAYSLEKVVEILGESAVADQLETLVYNAIPGTMTADCWAHQYDQQANQVKASNEKRQWTNNGPDANLYGLYPQYPCCLGNMHQGWPRFVQNLWMATGDGGIAAIAYGPSVVTTALQGTTVTVHEETEYPFDGRVRFVVQTTKPTRFPLVLRIPAWAAGATIKAGGEETRPAPGTWARMERTWNPGDVVEVNLPMTLRVERRHNNAAAILRGPLYYSLRIGKQYNELKSYNFRGAADWEILPTTPWNYGLEIDCNNPERNSQVIRNRTGSFPFGDRGDRLYSQQAGRFEDYSEEAPVVIKLPARRIPSWGMDKGSCADTPTSPVNCDAPVETIELVPYGCARLRVTEFPVAAGASGQQ